MIMDGGPVGTSDQRREHHDDDHGEQNQPDNPARRLRPHTAPSSFSATRPRAYAYSRDTPPLGADRQRHQPSGRWPRPPASIAFPASAQVIYNADRPDENPIVMPQVDHLTMTERTIVMGAPAVLILTMSEHDGGIVGPPTRRHPGNRPAAAALVRLGTPPVRIARPTTGFSRSAMIEHSGEAGDFHI